MTNARTPYTVIILARRQCYIYKKFFNIHCTVDACRDPPTKFNYEFEKYMSKNPSPLVKLLPLIRIWFYLFKILIDLLTGAKPVLLQIGASAREMKYCAGICIFLRTCMQLKRPNISLLKTILNENIFFSIPINALWCIHGRGGGCYIYMVVQFLHLPAKTHQKCFKLQ